MKLSKRILGFLLALLLVFGAAPAAPVRAQAQPAETLKFATMSDVHFYPQSMTGNCEAWLRYCRNDCKQYEESEAIIDTALDTLRVRARTEGLEYLLLPGDLTRYSEKQAHVELAEKLRRFEADTGVKVIVIDGNHDINCNKAVTFENGYRESAEPITAQGFYDVYADLGFDLADSFYVIENGKVPDVQNALSYTVQLGDKTQLIVVDSCEYSFGEAAKDITNGMITDECMAWITARADAAAAEGKESILMIHHSMAAHMKCEPSVTFAFVLDNYLERSEELADHHVHYALTGHLHIPDVAQVVNDNGETLTDVQTCALTAFPNRYRENTFTVFADGTSQIATEDVDFDAAAQYVYKGKTYARGAFRKEGFGLCFGAPLDPTVDAPSLTGFVRGLYENYASPILAEITGAGGLLSYLKTLGVDLRQIIGGFLSPYIGDGLKVGGKTVLSVDNVMWFLEDLSGQIDELIADPAVLWTTLEPAVRKIANLRMSDVPADAAVREAIGIGGGRDYGTLEDLVFTAVYYWASGNEPAYGEDALIRSVVELLRQPITENTGFSLSQKLIGILYNDVVRDILLANLHVRLNKLFGATAAGKAFGEQINSFVKRFLHGDTSYLNLVDTFFSLGALEDGSLYDLLDRLLLQKYWNTARDEALNATVAEFLLDFTTDDNPQLAGDYGVTYTAARQTPPATTENYRLPTMLTVTPGGTGDRANISWYSKYTLTESDVEIRRIGEHGESLPFTGAVETESQTVTRQYPGIDLGIVGFLQYAFQMVRHTARISGLEPGARYAYRVGSAARGWWSEWGTLEAPDGSDNVTFVHFSDPQCNNASQYAATWANTVNTAFTLYPDAAFATVGGNLTPAGMHVRQWQWLLDAAAPALGKMYLLPAVGAAEAKDAATLDSHFVLPGAAGEKGPYYSFDYNNLHVSVLNTEDLKDDGTLSDAQTAWLKADLSGSAAAWKIVLMNGAVYADSAQYNDKKVTALRRQLSALLPSLSVDLALQGRDCLYLRTAPLKNNLRALTGFAYLRDDATGAAYKTYDSPRGTVWAAQGSAGVERGSAVAPGTTNLTFPRAEQALEPDAPMFSAIRIRDGVLYFDAWTVNGDGARQVDCFAIRKDASQGDALSLCEWPEPQLSGGISAGRLMKFFALIRRIFTVLHNFVKVFAFGRTDVGFTLPKPAC